MEQSIECTKINPSPVPEDQLTPIKMDSAILGLKKEVSESSDDPEAKKEA